MRTLKTSLSIQGSRWQTLVPDSWRAEKQSSSSRGYGYKWQQARAGWLRAHPFCVMCLSSGRKTLATVLDHRIPHKGNMTLFWDSNNWQSLCGSCHSGQKAREEARDGYR